MNSKSIGFLIIGAQKSGTTSLADALNRHSQVFVCEPMEPEFFSRMIRQGPSDTELRSYRDLFSQAPEGVICGEASTGTMMSPAVMPSLEKYAPEAKLIALLRAPEKRAYSAFTHDCKKGRVKIEEQKTIFQREAEFYLKGEKGRFDWFLRSEYGRQLKPFADFFGERLKIVIFEELVANGGPVLRELQTFLGLTQEELFLTRENRSRVPKNKSAEQVISLGRKIVRPLRKLMSERDYRHFRETLMTRLGKSPDGLDEILAQNLRDKCYQSEIQILEELMGRRIEAWD